MAEGPMAGRQSLPMTNAMSMENGGVPLTQMPNVSSPLTRTTPWWAFALLGTLVGFGLGAGTVALLQDDGDSSGAVIAPQSTTTTCQECEECPVCDLCPTHTSTTSPACEQCPECPEPGDPVYIPCTTTSTETSTVTTTTVSYTTTTATTSTGTTTTLVAGSLLVPVAITKPSEMIFPPKTRAPFPPVNFAESLVGTGIVPDSSRALQTNKFWGNWIVEEGPWDYPIYVSPYTLKFLRIGESDAGGLHIRKGVTDYQGNPVTFFICHWVSDFIVTMQEPLKGLYTITKEGHFGVHVEVSGDAGNKVTYPVYAGMAYVSARFEGGATPKIRTEHGIKAIEKVQPGVWKIQNNWKGVKEYRLYVLDASGVFVDDTYTFTSVDDNSAVVLNKQLNGWIRLAYVDPVAGDGTATADPNTAVLDQHAQSVLVGWDLVITEGLVKYEFERVHKEGTSMLHWAYSQHEAFITAGGTRETTLANIQSPVKGHMFAYSGDSWEFGLDLTEAMSVGFLPAEEVPTDQVQAVRDQVDKDWEYYSTNWRLAMFRRDHYFSGKGFQKIGTLCLMLEKFYGTNDANTQNCAAALKSGFQCMYLRTVSDNSDRAYCSDAGCNHEADEGCWWAPFGAWYDQSWGGIPSRWDDSPTCGLDFGNSCYNDHHYHYAYYVVTASILVHLDPTMKDDWRFIDYVNMFIRDTSNPSTADPYFPQFRAFDWFDMHSWSRGLKRNLDGKDQESTSEEVNLHYGLVLWGTVTQNLPLKKLGATMLTVASRALQEYFLMRRDNRNYPANFAINHVTGIFFQNKVHLTTWFGQRTEYIHGIQMLPLSAGLKLSRTPEFAKEEWEDTLQDLEQVTTGTEIARWWSILYTGNLAFWKKAQAFTQLTTMAEESFDDGLIKSWALYWTAVQGTELP